MNYLERVFIFGAVAVGVVRRVLGTNCNRLASNKKQKKTKAKMHNLQATLAHDSFGRVGDVQLTVVGRHAAFSACQCWWFKQNSTNIRRQDSIFNCLLRC
ncbi:hypothetical protein T06_4507 [Trichinella sp. T6]|nr:hypothetical protein T06_4507 [Trichinella sp. T6]